MTYLTGTLTIRRDKHRLSRLITLSACVSAAVTVEGHGTVQWSPGDYAGVECKQFGLELHLPLWRVIEFAMVSARPASIDIGFESRGPLPGGTPNAVFPRLIVGLAQPIFVEFYENHFPWMKRTLGGGMDKWPDVLNFGRVIRNAASHRGCIHIREPNGLGGNWYHLSYRHADHGKPVIGAELFLGDLVILMCEISDELDRLGCPLDPPV
jgi:hypothetical protein